MWNTPSRTAFIICIIGALDALGALDGLLYVLLYVFGLAFAFYPLSRWCKEHEGHAWPWRHVDSEKKRIRKLRKELESEEKQDTADKDE